MRQSFSKCTRGNVAVAMALSLPVAVGAVSIAIDMSQASSMRAQLQQLADTAAVGGARELRLGNATEKSVLAVAQNYVTGAIAETIEFGGHVSEKKDALTVNLASVARSGLAAALGLTPMRVAVSATAKVVGGAPICALALDTIGIGSFFLEKNARMVGNECAIYSNAKHYAGLWAQDSAHLKASFICTAGGRSGGAGNFSPEPNLDCPAIPDPLEKRPAPQVGSCDPTRTGLRISGGNEVLYPGTYCGGLTISSGSSVTFSPGVYVIRNGPLVVNTGASITGLNTGFYFTGSNASFTFAKDTQVNLVAPKDGVMSGILFFQDRATPLLLAPPFRIASDNANVLLGTIYLPRSRLIIDGDKPVAQDSAYTILVTRYLTLSAGPIMQLNSNYSASDVPVPDGLGPLSNKVTLQK